MKQQVERDANAAQSMLPPRKILDVLLGQYFDASTVPWIWPGLHRPFFDDCYRAHFSGAEPPNIDFVGLLAAICVVALQFMPISNRDVRSLPRARSTCGSRFYSRRSCLLGLVRDDICCKHACSLWHSLSSCIRMTIAKLDISNEFKV